MSRVPEENTLPLGSEVFVPISVKNTADLKPGQYCKLVFCPASPANARVGHADRALLSGLPQLHEASARVLMEDGNLRAADFVELYNFRLRVAASRQDNPTLTAEIERWVGGRAGFDATTVRTPEGPSLWRAAGLLRTFLPEWGAVETQVGNWHRRRTPQEYGNDVFPPEPVPLTEWMFLHPGGIRYQLEAWRDFLGVNAVLDIPTGIGTKKEKELDAKWGGHDMVCLDGRLMKLETFLDNAWAVITGETVAHGHSHRANTLDILRAEAGYPVRPLYDRAYYENHVRFDLGVLAATVGVAPSKLTTTHFGTDLMFLPSTGRALAARTYLAGWATATGRMEHRSGIARSRLSEEVAALKTFAFGGGA